MRKEFKGGRAQKEHEVNWEPERSHHSERKEEEPSEEAEQEPWRDREPDAVGRGLGRGFLQKAVGDIMKCHRAVTVEKARRNQWVWQPRVRQCNNVVIWGE